MDIADQQHHDLLAYLYGRRDQIQRQINDAENDLKTIKKLIPILNPCKTCKGSGNNPDYSEADRVNPHKTMSCPTCHGSKAGPRDMDKYPKDQGNQNQPDTHIY